MIQHILIDLVYFKILIFPNKNHLRDWKIKKKIEKGCEKNLNNGSFSRFVKDSIKDRIKHAAINDFLVGKINRSLTNK